MVQVIHYDTTGGVLGNQRYIEKACNQQANHGRNGPILPRLLQVPSHYPLCIRFNRNNGRNIISRTITGNKTLLEDGLQALNLL